MEKPILFNTEMVKAIMGGRKTQTRRIHKHHAESGNYNPYYMPCRPGDILWVRET